MPLISIIVPIYKVREDYLRQCINSLINQTYKNVEIILVDDGTPDDGGSICDEYAEIDERVKVIHQKNQGVSFARNKGMDISSGEWVTFVDSDDWIEKDTFEILTKKISRYKLDILLFSLYVNHGDKAIENPFWFEERELLNSEEISDLQTQVLHKAVSSFKPPYNMVGVAVCKLYRKSYLESIKLRYKLGINLSEDGLFVFEALQNTNKVGYVNEFLYHYRKHSESATNIYRENAEKDYTDGLLEFKRLIDYYNKDKVFDIALWHRAIHNIFAVTEQLYCSKENHNGLNYNMAKLNELCNKEPYCMAIKHLEIKSFSNNNSLFRSCGFLLLKIRLIKTFFMMMLVKIRLKSMCANKN